MVMDIEELITRFDTIKSARSQWETHFQECADYALVQKAIVTKARTPGTKLKTDLYDMTAVQSAQIFAAGLQSYLVNPSSRWFALALKNRALMDDFENKYWLKECEDIIFDYINASTFNQVIGEDFIDFAVFGNSVLYEEEDTEDLISFCVRPIAEVYFLTDKNGRVDTIYRHFTLTSRQAMQQWGENAGQTVKDLIEAKKFEENISFLHIVLPREERDVLKQDARNMPHASIYADIKTKKLISEGGY